MNIAVLVSNKGTGSSLKALLAENFPVKLVIADTEDAAGIKIAKHHKIPGEVLPYKRPQDISKEEYRDNYCLELAKIINSQKLDIVVLAGFNRILTKPYFAKFDGITINIHPGAIPDEKDNPYKFEDGTEAPWNQSIMTETAVANFLPLKFATSTIHIVTEEADFGPVLKRAFVQVEKEDTIDTLYARLKQAEHKGLVEVLKNSNLV